jgi:hypothetical protein
VTAVRALFQQRVDGDDALLRLARLRFGQAGLGAEVYADSPEQLERILGFAPARPWPPVVHLHRGVDVLDARGRAVVEAFGARFAGRVWGLVVHDKAAMASRTDDLVEVLRALGGRPDRPYLFLEYAAGLEPGWFAEVAERLRDVERVSFCIDTGHVGIRQARRSFAREHPGLDLGSLSPQDARLPDLAADVQRAVRSALPAVLELTGALGRVGKPLHFHLHDGHPLIRGLSDHFSFLTQVPVPFRHEGRRALSPMYGPQGLAAIVLGAIEACGAERVSLTLEIHQAEGRLPLGAAAGLFRHWRDLTNAERMNYWLAVLAENAMLVASALPSRAAG